MFCTKTENREENMHYKYFLLFSKFYEQISISFQSVESLTGSPRRATGEVNRHARQTTRKKT